MSKDQRADPVYAREHAEPVERNNPVPWLLGLVAASLCVWGVSYFLLNPNLAPAPNLASATVSPAQGAAAAPQAPAPVAADGAQIFASRCASCHQATGAGLPGVFPPLAGSEWANADASQVAKILLLGIDGPITVKGAEFHGIMPAFGRTLACMSMNATLGHLALHYRPGDFDAARALFEIAEEAPELDEQDES